MKIGVNEQGRAVHLDPERLISTRMLVQANSGGGKFVWYKKPIKRKAKR